MRLGMRVWASGWMAWLCALGLGSLAGCTTGGAIPSAITAQLRQGVANLVLPQEGVVVPWNGEAVVPIVEVTVNGHGPYRFLIDAGGNVVSIRRDVALAVGAERLYRGAHRDVVRLARVQLGGAELGAVTAVAEPELDVDGVIGFNVFVRGTLTLDYPRHTLRWSPRADAPLGEGTTVAYQLRDRMPYVPVLLGAQTLWFNLDTGARGALYVPSPMEKTLPLAGPVTVGPTLWNQATGTFRTRQGTLAADLVLGAITLPHPTVTFSDNTEELLLGSEWLRRYAVTFELERQRVSFHAPAAP